MQLRRSKTPAEIWQRLSNADILYSESCAPGSFIYPPNGAFIRSKIFGDLKSDLVKRQYAEIVLPNVLTHEDLNLMNAIDNVEDLYLACGDHYMAPTHEAAFYNFLGRKLAQSAEQEIKIFNFGPAIRQRKKTYSIFRIGERTSFLEAYAYVPIDQVENLMRQHLFAGHKYMQKTLKLPSILANRPVTGNKKFNDRTYAVETLTRDGRTFTGPMVYQQSKRFLELIGALKTGSVVSHQVVHSGFTDNIFFSALDFYFSVDDVILPWELCPNHVCLTTLGGPQTDERDKVIRAFGQDLRVRFERGKINRNRTKCAFAYFEQGIPVVAQKTERHDWEVRTIFEKNVNFVSNIQELLKVVKETAKSVDQFLTSQRHAIEGDSVEYCHIQDVESVVKEGKVAVTNYNGQDQLQALPGIEFLGTSIPERHEATQEINAFFGRRI